MRFALPIAALGAAVISGPVALGQLSLGAQTVRRVPCAEAIAATAFPYDGYRLVLGVVSAPPAYMAQVVHVRNPAWPYWRKQGIVVRNSGETVTISVPRPWRNRAAIVWGNSGTGEPFQSVVLVGCGSEKTRGRAYAGGFYLRSRAACVPLTFRVGKRTSTVRFGIGRPCK